MAKQQRRLPIMFNPKDFRTLSEGGEESGVIGISHNLTDAQLDTKLVAFLRKTNPKRLYGSFHYISGET